MTTKQINEILTCLDSGKSLIETAYRNEVSDSLVRRINEVRTAIVKKDDERIKKSQLGKRSKNMVMKYYDYVPAKENAEQTIMAELDAIETPDYTRYLERIIENQDKELELLKNLAKAVNVFLRIKKEPQGNSLKHEEL